MPRINFDRSGRTLGRDRLVNETDFGRWIQNATSRVTAPCMTCGSNDACFMAIRAIVRIAVSHFLSFGLSLVIMARPLWTKARAEPFG